MIYGFNSGFPITLTLNFHICPPSIPSAKKFFVESICSPFALYEVYEITKIFKGDFCLAQNKIIFLPVIKLKEASLTEDSCSNKLQKLQREFEG